MPECMFLGLVFQRSNGVNTHTFTQALATLLLLPHDLQFKTKLTFMVG